MDRKFLGTLLLLLTSGGCCACDCSCDSLPPVLDGPYYTQGMRSGSAAGSHYSASKESQPQVAKKKLTKKQIAKKSNRRITSQAKR